MKNLTKTWNLLEFPKFHCMPKFLFYKMFGPDYALAALNALRKRNSIIEEFNFDYASWRKLDEGGSIEEGGDLLYVCYDEQFLWIFIMSTDLEWAVLFSNDESSKIMEDFDFESSSSDFEESYFTRTTIYKDYYNVGFLEAWRSIGLIQTQQ